MSGSGRAQVRRIVHHVFRDVVHPSYAVAFSRSTLLLCPVLGLSPTGLVVCSRWKIGGTLEATTITAWLPA